MPVEPYYSDAEVTIYHGDCRDVLPDLEPADTVVTDPPYGLSFMGQDWDHGVPGEHFWKLVKDAAKPGAMMMAFGGTRTFHRLMVAIEDGGWEIRDTMSWMYGTGFPKSLDVSKALDKEAGAEREVVGVNPNGGRSADADTSFGQVRSMLGKEALTTAPATDAAKKWDGWGSALKPSWEPVVLAMKPLDGTFAENATRHGVAGLWIDGARIGGPPPSVPQPEFNSDTGRIYQMKAGKGRNGEMSQASGRWPANTILQHHPECERRGTKKVEGASGWSKSGSKASENRSMSGPNYEREAKPDAFTDEDGKEEVEDWDCWEGGEVTVPEYRTQARRVRLCASPSILLDLLIRVLSREGTYNTACNSLARRADELAGIVGNESGASVPWGVFRRALGVTTVQDFRCDCPSCLRSCGECVRRIVALCRGDSPSLPDALDDALRWAGEHGHSQKNQPHDRHSSSGDSHQSSNAPGTRGNTTSGHIPQQSSGETTDRSEDTPDQGSSSTTRSTPESRTGEVYSDKKCHRTACTSAACRLVAGLLLDLASHALPSSELAIISYTRETQPCPVGMLDRQSGELTTNPGTARSTHGAGMFGIRSPEGRVLSEGDSGGASRFFYTAKASRSERGDFNNHPTVKPLAILEYLCRLTKTPDGGTVLDPFMGSGSTLIAAIRQGRKAVGIEKNEEYCEIAVKRLEGENLSLFGAA